MVRDAAPKLVDHRRLAATMGVRPATVRRWIDTGLLVPHSRIGNTYFFRSEDVDYYLKTGRWVREKTVGGGEGRDGQE